MERLPSGQLVTCRTRPKSPQLPLEASHLEPQSDLDSTPRSSSWAKHMSFEQCTNTFSSQDPQTEFALLRESLGASRINHILQVQGHTILQEQRAAEICDEAGQQSLERLPGQHDTTDPQCWPVRNWTQKS